MALVAASMVPSCVCHASWCSTRVVTMVRGMMGLPSGSRGSAMKLGSEARPPPVAGRGARGGACKRVEAKTETTWPAAKVTVTGPASSARRTIADEASWASPGMVRAQPEEGVKSLPSALYWPSPREDQTARARAGSQPHATAARHRCTPCSNCTTGPHTGPHGAKCLSTTGCFLLPTTSERALSTRASRPGKRCVSLLIAGAQSATRARTSATDWSAMRAVLSASARSARLAGVALASVKAAAHATRTSAASADSAASRRVDLCTRKALRTLSMEGDRRHNSDSFTKAKEEESGKGM